MRVITFFLAGGFSLVLWLVVAVSLNEGLEQRRVESKTPPENYRQTWARVASVRDVRIDYGMYEEICQYFYVVDSIYYRGQAPCCGLREGDEFTVMYDVNAPNKEFIVPARCYQHGWWLPILAAIYISISALCYSGLAISALISLVSGLADSVK